MTLDSLLIELIYNHGNSDNSVRSAAEAQFEAEMKADPTLVAHVLMKTSLQNDSSETLRQQCLIHLKQAVPLYWSLGFASFVGPPISQQVKSFIRQLLLMVVTLADLSKVRAAAAYAIVQIALADFPDEWPNLLVDLYAATQNYDNEIAIAGALTVLSDLFDDLVTDEQFWDGKIGSQVLLHILQMVVRPELSVETITGALKLYEHIIQNLSSPEALASALRKQWSQSCAMESLTVFGRLLETNSGAIQASQLAYRAQLYSSVAELWARFHKKVSVEIKHSFLVTTLKDLEAIATIVASTDHSSEQVPILVRNLINFLTYLSEDTVLTTQMDVSALGRCLITLTLLDESQIEIYESDIDEFVTDIVGLQMRVNSRECVAVFLVDLNKMDTNSLFAYFFTNLTQAPDWRTTESLLFVLDSLLQNTESQPDKNTSSVQLLQVFTKYAMSENHLVASRAVLLLPHLFISCDATLSAQLFGPRVFSEVLLYACKSSTLATFNLVKVSALVAAATYHRELRIATWCTKPLASECSRNIVKIILDVIDEVHGDGIMPALEAIPVIIALDPDFALQASPNLDHPSIMDLILKICFEDPGDVTFWSEAEETLNLLLSHASLESFSANCNASLPLLLQILESNVMENQQEYSSNLHLALDLLAAIISSCPGPSHQLPSDIFNTTFQLLYVILQKAQDPLIIQTSGGVLEALLKVASRQFSSYTDPATGESGLHCLLTLVSRFLSPQLSDSAAASCGAIVALILDKFQGEIPPQYFSQITEATARRLVVAKEPVFIENMVMVFCKLMLASPQGTVDFLTDLKLESSACSGLEAMLPIWFESYTLMSGYERISENTLALCRLYSLDDPRVHQCTVDGDLLPYPDDLIVTRLVAKLRPQQYTRIPAPLKIIKLVVNEFKFQMLQPDASGFKTGKAIADAEDDSDADEWEEMEDIGIPTFDKLRQYVESDESDGEEDNTNNDGLIMRIISSFLKECTAHNLGRFGTYYEQLDDTEKESVFASLEVV